MLRQSTRDTRRPSVVLVSGPNRIPADHRRPVGHRVCYRLPNSREVKFHAIPLLLYACVRLESPTPLTEALPEAV